MFLLINKKKHYKLFVRIKTAPLTVAEFWKWQSAAVCAGAVVDDKGTI